MVLSSAAIFVLLTIWQSVGKRDDWPLSDFSMYSTRQGKGASRTVLRGVSGDGEFPLTNRHTAPLSGPRLRHLNDQMRRSATKQRKFLTTLQRRYERQRELRGWPELQAIRMYTESWRIQPGLKGMERPHRRLSGVAYLPPHSLLERLRGESSGEAEPLDPRPLAQGDLALELEQRHCEACALVETPYASEGSVLRLDPEEGANRAAFDLKVPAGTWYVYVRAKTGSWRSLTLKVSGAALRGAKRGLRTSSEFPRDAWVWVSADPGNEPAQLKWPKPGKRRFVLAAEGGSAEVDQIWLSREQRELPLLNAPVEP